LTREDDSGPIFVYEGTKDDQQEANAVYVSHETKMMLGVTCVVAEDTVLVAGKLEEATLDWYAQDKGGNVWYLDKAAADCLTVTGSSDDRQNYLPL
jgi:hypothetical protein